ncbi:SCO-spondin [Holothuria leucospilota]|uniref:SCO-spondin n=1 Tax=Holothuria leucospilota TaxID=206669 RepID=A0A9Q1BBU0_HOLLE|nr:SCO-spondin [Holothuria leucospilota]
MYKRQANSQNNRAADYLHCSVWSQRNYRTFDGFLNTFDNGCEFVLARLDDTVTIKFITNKNCFPPQAGDLTGPVMVDFDFGMEEPIYLLNEAEGGGASQSGQRLELPYKGNDLSIIAMDKYILVELEDYGWSVLYDMRDYVSIVVLEENSVEKARGLCGNCDEDDTKTLMCQFDQTTKHLYSWGTIEPSSNFLMCNDTVSASQRQKCDYLTDTSIFGPCHGLGGLNLQDYIDACYADVCETEASASNGAECNSIAAYVQECSKHLGPAAQINWRTDSICPYTCQNGSEHMSCPSVCDDNSCYPALHCEQDEVFGCLEGCRCPPDQFLKDGVCTSKEECPCEHRGKTIPNGDTVTDDCNICECSSGELQCTENICPATCTVAGYVHHSTFDNKQFNFQGNCEYTMLKDCWNDQYSDTKYEIRAENENCEEEGYSCIKAVVIEYRDKTIRVALDRTVTIDGNFITLFPHVFGDIYIDNATKNTTIVHLGNGVTVRWDRYTTMAIEVKAEHYNHTCGLCGTFNQNQMDDFYTDADCHSVVGPSAYIKKCKTDFCSCKRKKYCHCAAISEYASECFRKGVKNIDWRAASSECAIDDCAKDGLIYTQCLPSCQSSCAARSFSSEYTCHDICIEGCVCPSGQIKGLNGTCIELDKCHCTFNGELFASGESRMERCGVCTCENGSWQCDVDKNCTNATCGENEEYVTCLTPCPKTCDNANNYEGCSMSYVNCTSGCQCQPDKVLHNGLCIPIESCPCEHSGLTYKIGDRVKETDCTEIICSENGWISKPLDFCPGKCSAYGNTHVKTFDSKTYDFQGDCEYIFAETIDGADAEPFQIIIKNIPCGLHGITCTKSIEFIIGDPDDSETIFLVRGRPTPAKKYPASGFTVVDTGTVVMVLTKIGVTLVWHKNTFLEVQLDPNFRNKVHGLCGNYDNNADNDFQTRSGGQTSDDSLQFSYEWRVSSQVYGSVSGESFG